MLITLKTPEEQKGFAEAGRIAGSVLSVLLAAVRPGAKPSELDEIAREECRKAGAKPAFLGYDGFPAAVCVSVNNGLVHGLPGDRPFEEGDVVSVDVGADVDGFIGDTADTVIAGRARSPKDDELVVCCRDALRRGIEAARPGNTLGDIGAAIAQERRFGIITNYGGHGLDRNHMHSDPFVANEGLPGSGPLLRAGMIIAIEPMLVSGRDIQGRKADDGWTIEVAKGMAAHAEHTVALTEEGPVVLTAREEKE